jgi:short-subunit dehydrogenase
MNKLIVVTGGTKGIGKAIIEKFAAQNYDIITCARNEKDLINLKDNIERSHSVQFFYTISDLSKKEDSFQFVDFVKGIGRPVDILVNNAGTFIPGQVHTEEDGLLEQMMNTNLYSAYHISRGLINGMKERKHGDIFNMCSIASIIAYPNGGSYTITKYALLGMTKVLREEMKGFGVRVIAVLPGATLTASWEGVDLPKDRFIKSEDIAEAVWSAHSLSRNSVVEEIIIRPQLGDIN